MKHAAFKTYTRIIALASAIGLSLPLHATLIATQTGTGTITPFTVSNTDLLQTSLDSAVDGLTLNVGENNAAGANSFTVLHNGVFGDTTVNGKFEAVVINSGTITYNLDVSSNTLGYELTQIDTYAGWADNNRGSQAYTVKISLIGSPTFTDLFTVTMNPDAFTQERFSITEDTSGILATGVDAIQFDLPAQQFDGVGYKEFDVFGTAVIPEPSAIALLGLGIAVLGLRKLNAQSSVRM